MNDITKIIIIMIISIPLLWIIGLKGQVLNETVKIIIACIMSLPLCWVTAKALRNWPKSF